MPVKSLKKCNALNQNYIKVKISDNFHLTIIIFTKFVLARSMMFCNITCFYKNKGNYSGLAFHSSRFKVSSRSASLLGNEAATLRIMNKNEKPMAPRWTKGSSAPHPLPQREEGAALMLHCCVFKVPKCEPGTMNLR